MALHTLDLNGRWEFKEYPESARRMRDLEDDHWRPAEVPSSIYTCLIDAELISSFDLQKNPEKYAWVSEKSWVFRKSFTVPETFGKADRIDLLCEGLDTVSHLWLNEKLIAKTDNMFLTWRFPVTGHLKPGDNTLMIKFEPALHKARQRMNRYGPLSDRIWGDPARVYLRKAQYQFGSPVSPSLPGCGIWRPISLEAVETARLDHIQVRTVDCSEQAADLSIAVFIERIPAHSDQPLSCRLQLADKEPLYETTIRLAPNETAHTSVLRIDRPRLWWPSGCGQPHLYTLTVSLWDQDHLIDERRMSFGIRTLQLRRSPEAAGNRFQFVVNHQPVVIRGMHWLPGTLFPGSRAENYEKNTLARFQKVGGNMLRIWAGGFYESPEFYALCDRLGILIWQDFPFAEAYYPDRKWFLQAVEAEADQLLKRLRNHPSIALWCGNSRCDQRHTSGQLGKGRKFYGKGIYHILLPNRIKELDPDRPYIATAPGEADSGLCEWDSLPEDEVKRKPPEDEMVPGFCSGFGCRSLPARETAETCLSLFSPSREKDYLPSVLKRCAMSFPPPRDFDEMILQSQIVQARLMKQFAERWRTRRSCNDGWLMKTWNSCGPVIDFAAIDSAGRPKAVYYYAARFMNPLLATLLDDPAVIASECTGNGPLQAIVLNDRNDFLTAILRIELMNAEGILLDQIRIPVSLGPFKHTIPFPLPRNMATPPDPDKVFLYLALQSEEHILAENLFFFVPDKWFHGAGTSIDCRIEPQDNKTWNLIFTSRRIIRDLCIHLPAEAEISDNFFDLLPNQTRTLSLRFQNPAPPVPIPFRLSSASFCASKRHLHGLV